MLAVDERVTILGRTNFRKSGRLFGIKHADRRHHIYIIGKTGTGKSTLLETMALQDVAAGEGLAVIDPHGDLVERIRMAIPEGRQPDLIDFNVPDQSSLLGFNPLDAVPPQRRALAAAGMLEAFKKLWPDSWGPRTEHLLRPSFLAVMDQPQATLADILRLLDDTDYRKRVVGRVMNVQVRRFWLQEYENYPARFRAEVIAPIQNKVGAFLADPTLQRILMQPKSSFDLRRVMDEGQILLVNLARGQLGEDPANLLGSLLVSHLGLAGLSRADTTEDKRRDFFVYLDEFQSFTTLSLATMLAELRKYRVSLTLAHQFLLQLTPEVRAAVLGNVGSVISFRLGLDDAEVTERAFYPVFSAADLVEQPNYTFYVRLLVDGKTSRSFSAEALPRS